MDSLPHHDLAQTATAQTIFAPATGVARAAITVVRLSGALCSEILVALTGSLPVPRRAGLRALRWNGAVLDRALVLWFPGPDSYTGEDCAELHLHGGRAVLAAVSAALRALGARPAEPGEFTRRALLGGRMDVLAAEAIGDLVAAETEAQRIQALRQMDGALGALYGGWTARLTHILAWQEAQIDFSDQDLPDEVAATVRTEIAGLQADITSHLGNRRGERLREGLVFVVVGAPNVGKSSLLNALAGEDIAIVSPIPGTTRDAVSVRLDCGGIPVSLIDTAGLRAGGLGEGVDAIEAEGMRRALARAQTADLVIGVIDGSQPSPVRACDLQLANKTDLHPAPAGALGVSALTGAGLPALRARLAAEAARLASPGDAPALTRARHRAALDQALAHLADAVAAPWADQRAEDLRLALRCLGRITGEVAVESVLDEVFSSFCIGK